MLICEFLVAIVGVTAGHPVQTAGGITVNLAAQRVLIAFTCMLVVVLLLRCRLFNSFGQLHCLLCHLLGSCHLGPYGRAFCELFFLCVYPVLTVLSQPLGIRAKSMSFTVASNWLWNFGIAYATPYLVNPTTTGINGVKAANLGVKVFFIWGSTCVGCLIFTYVIL